MKKFTFKIEDRTFDIAVNMQNNSAVVYVNGDKFDIVIDDENEDNNSSDFVADKAESFNASNISVSSSSAISSPLPGILSSVKVKVGEKVRKGQILAVVEAMKMENELLAEQDGVIRSISASPGDTLMEGSPIMIIDNL